MSSEPPWGGYPQQPESTNPSEYPPAPGYPPPPEYQPAPGYPSPPIQPGYAPPPPPGYGQPAYPSQPMYPPQGQPAYPSQPLYPPPPAYPSQPMYPPQMGYPAQPAYPGMPAAVPDSKAGLAVAGLVLGIISMVAWILPICGFPFSIVGIILSSFGMGSPTRRTMATVGLVLAIIGLTLSLGNSVLGAIIRAGQ